MNTTFNYPTYINVKMNVYGEVTQIDSSGFPDIEYKGMTDIVLK